MRSRTAKTGSAERARAPASVPEPAARSRLDPATFAFFRRLSSGRGRRIFHPRGVAYAAHFSAALDCSGATILSIGFEHRALVRLSRGLGLRPPLPDVFGLAIRLPDVYGPGANQDFLLASSGDGPLGRRLLRPALEAGPGTYSSLLPYEIGARRVLVGARATASSATAAFEVLVASPAGAWQPVGRVTLGRRLDDSVARALRFDPWNSGGGIVPAGLINRLRGAAYRGSRRGSVA